jgi:serine/threonine protein phosphatase PrpC
VVTSDGYLYGELAVARAIGSQHLKLDPTKRAFTHMPDIHTVILSKDDDILLLATDGLWDKVDNSEAVAAARRCMARDGDAGAAARALVDRAVRQSSTDNISVVVVRLHDRGISLPHTNSMLFRRPQEPSSSASSRPATPGSRGCPAAGGLMARGEAPF